MRLPFLVMCIPSLFTPAKTLQLSYNPLNLLHFFTVLIDIFFYEFIFLHAIFRMFGGVTFTTVLPSLKVGIGLLYRYLSIFKEK